MAPRLRAKNKRIEHIEAGGRFGNFLLIFCPAAFLSQIKPKELRIYFQKLHSLNFTFVVPVEAPAYTVTLSSVHCWLFMQNSRGIFFIKEMKFFLMTLCTLGSFASPLK